MALLTVSCGKCVHVGLEEQQELLRRGLHCRACNSTLHVLPSCSFSEQDRELFEDLRQVVTERTISGAEAKALAADIAGVLRSGSDRGILERLTGRLPGLLPVQLVAGENKLARLRALKILRAILEAKSFASPPS